MTPMPFQLQATYQPAGDQPKAIHDIISAFEEGKSKITLLGATGTGKTFTIANIIQQLQKPTLVISHNKTLAAQLSTEFKHFFPKNAVHYFVSYFDYYQPESYLPTSGTYIEKEATINQDIEMYRLATMASLLSREDVIVVASASSLYGLGQARFFRDNCLQLKINQNYQFSELKKQLLRMQYKPVHGKIEPGMFDVKGEVLEIYSSTEKSVYKCFFNEDFLEQIEIRDSLTFELKNQPSQIILWPATQYIQDTSDMEVILQQIDAEKQLRVKELEKAGLLVEAERVKKRVEYDIRMIKET
jgi:excinuclease ABC subunit B